MRTPPLVVAPPAHLHAAGVFGDWSPVDRSTPARARIEDRLDFLFDHHRGQAEQRSWYGFWDYGDIMHSYDPDRHVWRYDVGTGTDWSGLAPAWLTEWERGGDPIAREKLLNGMRIIAAMPNGFAQGSGLYDLDNGEFAPAHPR